MLLKEFTEIITQTTGVVWAQRRVTRDYRGLLSASTRRILMLKSQSTKMVNSSHQLIAA